MQRVCFDVCQKSKENGGSLSTKVFKSGRSKPESSKNVSRRGGTRPGEPFGLGKAGWKLYLSGHMGES